MNGYKGWRNFREFTFPGTSVNKASEDALCFFKWQHLCDRTMYREKEDRYGRPE